MCIEMVFIYQRNENFTAAKRIPFFFISPTAQKMKVETILLWRLCFHLFLYIACIFPSVTISFLIPWQINLLKAEQMRRLEKERVNWMILLIVVYYVSLCFLSDLYLSFSCVFIVQCFLHVPEHMQSDQFTPYSCQSVHS